MYRYTTSCARHVLRQKALFSTTAHHDQIYDVLIAGGGIVGSALACVLKANPVMADKRIGVIEPSAPMPFNPDTPDLRVYTMAPSSQKILQDAGAWSRIPKSQLVSFQDMQVWETTGNGFIRFCSREINKEQLGFVVENNVLHRALAEQLQVLADIPENQVSIFSNKVQQFHSPTEDERFGRVVLDDETEVRARLIVAADGANSTIRQQAKIGSWGWQYDQKAVVATIKTDRHHGTAWQRFLPTGPLAVLPMRDGFSSIVWSCDNAMAEVLVKMDPEDFLSELNHALTSPSTAEHDTTAFPNIPILKDVVGGVKNAAEMLMSATALSNPFEHPPMSSELIGKRFALPLKMNHAVNYTQPGVALIGDSAHTIHPLAGQGLNLGLTDVESLSKVISKAVYTGQDIGSSQVLSAYESDRKNANIGMAMVMDGLKRLFGPVPTLVNATRNLGLGTLNGIPLVKVCFVR